MTIPDPNSAKALQLLQQLLADEKIDQAQFQIMLAATGPSAVAGSATAAGEQAQALAAQAVAIDGDNTGSINTGVQLITHNGAGKVAGASADALRCAYLTRLMMQCNQMPLLAGDSLADKLRLTSVYTALLTQRSTEPDLSMHQAKGKRSGEHRPKQHTALDVLNAEPHLALLGDPGSGKSTFVNIVTLALAGEALGAHDYNLEQLAAPLPEPDSDDETRAQTWDHDALLPVRVVLRDFATTLPATLDSIDANTLWRYVADQLEMAQLSEFAVHLETHLRDHGGLILLDGLDEVPDALGRRDRIKRAIDQFRLSFHRCRFLATSRTYAYQKQSWKLDGFREAVLAPFQLWQIDALVTRWYEQMASLHRLSAADSSARAARLQHAVRNNPRVAVLAERPLLLTLITRLQTEKGGELPEKPAELYSDAVSMLLDIWERSKSPEREDGKIEAEPSLAEYLRVGRDRIRRVLDRLAFEAHRDQPEASGSADIRTRTLISALLQATDDPDVKPARLEEYLRDRAGILTEHGVGVYQFPHRSFQEYLAACHLTNDDFPDKLSDLVRADPNRWREVVLLAAAKAATGSLSNAWLLAETLCPTAFKADPQVDDQPVEDTDAWGALLSGQVIAGSTTAADIAARDQGKFERIRDWQIAILRGSSLPSVERALAGRTLAALGDPRPEVMTLDGMEFCYVPEGPFWMGSEREVESQPLHQLDLPAFWIARYPVTAAQWREYLRISGLQAEKTNSKRGRSNDPIHSVSWHEALAFSRSLTDRWADQLPSGMTVQLPSEAEWEKAARGGLQVPANPVLATAATLDWSPAPVMRDNPSAQREFPWGEQFDADCANADRLGTSTTGAYPRGASGNAVEELSGNVWEWTRSIWGSDWSKSTFGYPYRTDELEREDLSAGSEHLRLVRGGSWLDSPFFARCVFRNWYGPDARSVIVGFRVVLRSAPVP